MFKHEDNDGDVVEVKKANASTPVHHYFDVSSRLGAYVPFTRTSELVASLYENMGVESKPTPIMVYNAEQAERYAAAYARAAVAFRQRDTRQEARDQLVKDFFKRTKDVALEQVTPENRTEYEVTCRFFDTLPYDAPGAR